MRYEIQWRVLPEQATAVVKASLPVTALPEWLPKAYQDVAEYLSRSGVGTSGPPVARYRFHEDLVDVEAGFPVSRVVAGDGNVVPSSLPAGPAAVTTHYGPYEKLDEAYRAVDAWLAERGHHPAGPHWEVYWTDPRREPEPARWRTDLVTPFG